MVGTRANAASGPGNTKPRTPTLASNLGLTSTVSSMNDRLSALESLVHELVSRVVDLETENIELKSKLTSSSYTQDSPVQQFLTPHHTAIRNHNIRPRPIFEDVLAEEPPEADIPEGGEWVTVVNRKNRIIKKFWKASKDINHINHINNNPVGNDAQSKTQKATQDNRGNNRNNDRRNGRKRSNNRNFGPHKRFNHGQSSHTGNNHQMSQLLNGLSNFLMLQTRQPMPIYQNRYF